MSEDKLFCDPKLTLPDLARKSGLSVHQLSELLNRELEIGFNSWINQFRIEMAKELLIKRPDLNVFEICLETGFNSKSAFNTAFRNSTGYTSGIIEKDLE